MSFKEFSIKNIGYSIHEISLLWGARNVKSGQGSYQAVTQPERGRGEKFLGEGSTYCHGHSFLGVMLVGPAFCGQRLSLGEEPYILRKNVRQLSFHPDTHNERKSYIDVLSLWQLFCLQKDCGKFHFFVMCLIGEDNIDFFLMMIFFTAWHISLQCLEIAKLRMTKHAKMNHR